MGLTDIANEILTELRHTVRLHVVSTSYDDNSSSAFLGLCIKKRLKWGVLMKWMADPSGRAV